ncbi:phosphoglycerate kinase, partial [Baffinella frigidus]
LDKKSIADIDVTGKRVLMRVDFNVPQDKAGAITNTQRIVGAIPTIDLALKNGAKAVILMSHLGRPDGKPDAALSLKPIAEKLGEIMGKPVIFVGSCVGPEAEAATKDPAAGSIIVIENVRFHKEEEGKGINHVEGCKKKKCGDDCVTVKASAEEVKAFQEGLAKHGDVYVCDAFGTAHRAHASLVGMKGKMPCVAGLLVQKELSAFSKVLDPATVKRPLLAIVGGAKISDKILVIENLIKQSLFDKKGAELAPKLMEMAKTKGIEITLPVDWACGQDFCNDQEIKMVTDKEGIPDGWEGMDCGPESMKLFREKIIGAKTVIWNGPAGVFEFDNFAKGTKAVLDAVAETTALGNAGIIGGGDSATAAAKFDMENQVTFVSTGGGASLELLEGKVLPGIDALDAK